MKNLTELGRYIELLVNGKCSGNFTTAAKALGISGAELSALRNGKRQSPNPEILKKICEELGGDYYILFELSGYSPPIRPSLPVVNLPHIKGSPPECVGSIECPVSWLLDRDTAKGYFWIEIGFRILLVRITDEWNDGDIVYFSGGDFARAYKCHDKVELLSFGYPSIRKMVDEISIRGIVERIVIDCAATREW